MSNSRVKVRPPSWFRPRNERQEAVVRNMLREQEGLDRLQETRVEAAKASALSRAADLVRMYDARSLHFLGGQAYPWTTGSWQRIQTSRFRQRHPWRFLLWRLTGLLGPA